MLKNYLKVAWKVILRRKFFTFISLFGIAFTLVVLMVATAVLDHLLAPEAPEVNGDRSLYLMSMAMIGPNASSQSSVGYGLLDRWIRPMPGVEKVAIFSSPSRMPIYHEGQKLMTFVRRNDGAFWEVMNFDFLEGGPFTAEDDREGRRVAVINAGMRRRLFNGEPALGRTFDLDGDTYRVVGVVRDVPMARYASFSEVWLPIGTLKGETYKHELLGDFAAVIVARDREDFADIKAEVQSRLRRVEIPQPEIYDRLAGNADTLFEFWSRSIFSDQGDESSHAGWLRAVMIGAALLFMLLPTVNLVNINLSRILERASEIGVRKAFGASSRTLVGQFVVENVVLTMIGGMLGFALSWIALAALNRSELIPYASFQMNLRIFGYAIFLAAFFGVLSGVYPAWRMSRLHPVEALRGRTT